VRGPLSLGQFGAVVCSRGLMGRLNLSEGAIRAKPTVTKNVRGLGEGPA
jgi:hypothetical protein